MSDSPIPELTESTLFAAAQALETAWVQQDPGARLPLVKAFPSPIRPCQPLWIDSPPQQTFVPRYPPCPRCQTRKFQERQIVEGVRHNGDGYGCRYDTCPTCGWTCWWKYDDAA